MTISKATFDAIPDLVDTNTREAWQDCVLQIVDQFSLTQAQYDLIAGRYETISKIFDAPHDPDLAGTTFFTQGSFLTRTVIRPPSGGEIDVDAIVWSPNTNKLTAQQLFDAVHVELDARVRTEHDVVPKNRCITVVYADEAPAFHLDVTPAINTFGNTDTDGRGKLRVPDRKAIKANEAGGWKHSAPKLFADWVESQAQYRVILQATYDSALNHRALAKSEPLPGKEELDRFDPLRAAIKLLKYHREKFFEGRDDADFKPISVLLTTLACKAYKHVALQSGQKQLTPMEAIIAIIDRLDQHFDEVAPGEWRLCNPVYDTENFAERWNDRVDGPRRVAAFKIWHEQVKRDIRLGLKAFDSKSTFVEAVVGAFGTRQTSASLTAYLDTAISTRGAVPGLSQSAVQRTALGTAFGIGTSKPRQEAQPLNRLG